MNNKINDMYTVLPISFTDLSLTDELPQVLPYGVFGKTVNIEEFICQLRKSTIGSLITAKLSYETLAGRYCAAAALESLGINNHSVPKGYDRAPVWPYNVTGSIAHSKEVACAVVSWITTKRKSIGIDVENLLTLSIAHEIAPFCLTPQEFKQFELSDNPALFMTAIFSIKESFYKASYPMIKQIIEFKDVEISGLDISLNTTNTILKCSKLGSFFNIDISASINNQAIYSLVTIH